MQYEYGNFVANEAQTEAITHPAAPLMILAGAGTGKTTTLIHRINYLISKKLANPENIVLLTFTEKATEELRLKLKNILNQNSEEILVTTFHGFCNFLLREYGNSNNLEKILLDESEIIYLFADRYDELTNLTSSAFRSNPLDAIQNSFIPFFNRLRDELINPATYKKESSKIKITSENIFTQFPVLSNKTDPEECGRQLNDLMDIYLKYQLWKQEKGAIDYADMVFGCWDMLRKNDEILKQVRNRFKHVIIDEYQDNNYALNKIVHLITEQNPSITVVGDEDQCIYSFRGANYHNIKDFRKKYSQYPGMGEVTLLKNYRSTEQILNLANFSISNDRNRTAKILISSDHSIGDKPVWYNGTHKQTMDQIPVLIQQILNNDHVFGDIAILCRTWRQCTVTAKALQQASIPTDIFVEHFFSIPVIKDSLAWVSVVIQSDKYESAFYRLLSKYIDKPISSEFVMSVLSEDQLDDISDDAKLFQDDNIDDSTLESINWILSNLRHLRSLVVKNLQADEMLWQIFNITDIVAPYRSNYRYLDRLSLINIGHLLKLAESFSIREDDNSLSAWNRFLEILSLNPRYPAVQPLEYDHGAIQIMTIHKSKGLEFPIVIMPFLRSASFPTNFRTSKVVNTLPEAWFNWPNPYSVKAKDQHINEERRIFYVGVTRAQKELYLFGPEKSKSIFLKELLAKSGEIIKEYRMVEETEIKSLDQKAKLKDRLYVELNRELAAHQYINAHLIIDAIEQIEKVGVLSDDHFYSSLISENKLLTAQFPDENEQLILSASAVEEYLRCPLKYRLNRIDKIHERKSKVQMEFGSIIHKILDEFHRNTALNLEQLLKLLEKHWRSDVFEYLIREKEFKAQAKIILEDYYKNIIDNPPEVVATEAPFSFVLEDSAIKIVGKIDRIDSQDNRLDVIDYKTSQSKDIKAKNSLQLALYIEAIKRDAIENINGLPGTAKLYYLRHAEDPVDGHAFTDAEWNEIEKKIIAV
ncbi:ATP-dependent helicase, partial [Candidatus Neomarinimicrobiota bacterium]